MTAIAPHSVRQLLCTQRQLRGGLALKINHSVNAIDRLASQTVGNNVSTFNSYTFTWANAPADTHSLTARATDSNGAVSASAALAITVVAPIPLPPVVFSGPSTEHLYNGAAQRTVRVQPEQQSVYVYGQEGHTVLAEVQRNLSSSVLTTTEHIYLPTASGPMPVAVVLNGAHYAVHTDHLNTPRRLTNSVGQPVWQWAFSGFGEVPAQALPPAGQAAVNYNLRYPGQVDDGNGLFYNWNRFYDVQSGRYVSSDPIGLEGGWNRFAYVGGNPLSGADPRGLKMYPDDFMGPLPPDGYHKSQMTKTRCGLVPPAPPGADIVKNMSLAKGSVNPVWFRDMVKNKGPWTTSSKGRCIKTSEISTTALPVNRLASIDKHFCKRLVGHNKLREHRVQMGIPTEQSARYLRWSAAVR